MIRNNQMDKSLIFLKLGGSLITDKSRPNSARKQLIHQIVKELKSTFVQKPDLRLLIGHGSGSFGHVPAKEYKTIDGVHSLEEWIGFAQVWYAASSLHRIVVEALHAEGMVPISIPPSACVSTQNREIISWDLQPIEQAMTNDLLPVTYGDVVFDTNLGGTILSTESLFIYLAKRLKPQRILLAGHEPGVWQDYPERSEIISEITPSTARDLTANILGADESDVTGGMGSKVMNMLELVKTMPEIEVNVFSGLESGNIMKALLGERLGTAVCADR